jgi:hypothetical protein
MSPASATTLFIPAAISSCSPKPPIAHDCTSLDISAHHPAHCWRVPPCDTTSRSATMGKHIRRVLTMTFDCVYDRFSCLGSYISCFEASRAIRCVTCSRSF